MSAVVTWHRNVTCRAWTLAGALIVACVALAAMPAVGSAQAPLEPRPANTCRASLTISPGVVGFGTPRPVTVSASGLEPGVSYRLYFNATLVSSRSVEPDGTVEVRTTVESEISLLVNVQVVTEARCAAGTLVVAGPRRATCEVLLLPGLPPFCQS